MKTSTSRRNGYTKFGKQVKKWLIDNNTTATQLANEIGTTPQYLNKILHGERSGSKYMDELIRILNIKTVA